MTSAGKPMKSGGKNKIPSAGIPTKRGVGEDDDGKTNRLTKNKKIKGRVHGGNVKKAESMIVYFCCSFDYAYQTIEYM